MSPLESGGGRPPVLCQGSRMEVRRGVLRCSSRKLRSSSFVELVALDTNRRQQLKSLQRVRKHNCTFYGKSDISSFKFDDFTISPLGEAFLF